MKKFILSILILLIAVPGFAQYGQLGGGISGISLEGTTIIFGSPADSVIFEIPVSFESTITITTLIGTSFKIFNTEGDSMIFNPDGFSGANSAVVGTAVFNYKSRGGHSVIIDSLSAYISVYDSPTANVSLFNLGTSDDADRFKVDEDGDVTNDGSTTSGGAISGTDLTATTGDVSVGDDVLLADGAVVGITGNEVITFNAAGSINFTGATVDIDGAFSASSVASDGDVSGTTGTFTGTITDGTYSSDGSGNFSAIGTIATTGAATFGSTGSFESTLTINPTVADAEDPSLILKTDADDDGTVFVSEAFTINYAAVADPTAGLWTATTTQSAGFDFDMPLIASTLMSDGLITSGAAINVGGSHIIANSAQSNDKLDLDAALWQTNSADMSILPDIGDVGTLTLLTAGEGDFLVVEGTATFNEAGNDHDFKVETAGEDSALVVDGADGDVFMEGLGSGTAKVLGRILNTDEIVEATLMLRSATAGITATDPGVQGNSPLTTDINEVDTVANDDDAVTLPTAVAGLEIFIINNGANTLEIWPASGDDLGAGVDTATTLASGANVTFVAYNDVNWETK